MEVFFLVEILIDAVTARKRADKTDSDLCRFFHDIAERSGQFQFATAVVDEHLDFQYVAADRRICQPVDHADKIILLCFFLGVFVYT